ncbi:transporter [bacterium]|nr:transporter [bacterium]
MVDRKRNLLISGIAALLFVFVLSGFAQTGADNVRLFQSYLIDAPIAKTHHVQPGLIYDTYEGQNVLKIGSYGGFALNKKIELLGSLGFLSISHEHGKGQSGLSDLAVYARYKLSDNKDTQFSTGGMLTLPIGSEDVSQGNFNFGGYGAVRHQLEGGIVITGNLALIFYEAGDDRESSLEIGAGVIYPMDKKFDIVGEMVIKSEFDFMMLSAGMDYNMGGGRVRGALGFGVDDGAPDFEITAGYLLTL